MSKILGAKDLKPRKKRTDNPVPPHSEKAAQEGRTEAAGSIGNVSPLVLARLISEGDELSWSQRVDRTVTKLIEMEG